MLNITHSTGTASRSIWNAHKHTNQDKVTLLHFPSPSESIKTDAFFVLSLRRHWHGLGPCATVPGHFICSDFGQCVYKDTYSPGFMSFRRTTQTRTLHLIARLVFRLSSYHQALWLSYIGLEQWLENGWVCPPGWGIRNISPGPQMGERRLFFVRSYSWASEP